MKINSLYYSFGSPMPNRTFSSSSYRYGFNGKENDDDFKGNGNSIDYGFRIYDARIGKFLSIDPLVKDFPFYSPYQFAGNKPIAFLDIDGREDIYYNHPALQSRAFKAAVDLIKSTDVYAQFTKDLKGANAVDVVFCPVYFSDGTNGMTVFISKDEYYTSDYSDAEFRGVDLQRSNRKGRDVVVVYISQSLINEANNALSEAYTPPYLTERKENPVPMKTKLQLAQAVIEELAFTIGHELKVHTVDYLDKKNDVATGTEHKQFYDDAEFYKQYTDQYSPSYKNIKSDSEAGELKKEIQKNSESIVEEYVE